MLWHILPSPLVPTAFSDPTKRCPTSNGNFTLHVCSDPLRPAFFQMAWYSCFPNGEWTLICSSLKPNCLAESVNLFHSGRHVSSPRKQMHDSRARTDLYVFEGRIPWVALPSQTRMSATSARPNMPVARKIVTTPRAASSAKESLFSTTLVNAPSEASPQPRPIQKRTFRLLPKRSSRR